MSAQEKLQGKIAEMATDAILEGIMLIGGGSILDGEITKEQQIVRAAMESRNLATFKSVKNCMARADTTE